MISQDHFVENYEYRVRYMYGGDFNEDSGKVKFYIDGDDNHEGIILEPVDNAVNQYPTRLWIPYGNILEVSFR